MNITDIASLAGNKAWRKSQKKQVKSKNENKQEKEGQEIEKKFKNQYIRNHKNRFFHFFLEISFIWVHTNHKFLFWSSLPKPLKNEISWFLGGVEPTPPSFYIQSVIWSKHW